MKKLTLTLIAILLIVGALTGCSKVGYNATVLNGNASEWINVDFYNRSHTRGALYDGENAPEDEANPESRFCIVRSRKDQDAVFAADASIEVDYSREMLVVYTFTSVYVREKEIKEATIKSDELQLVLEMKKPFGGDLNIFIADACAPFQRYVVVKLDKQEFSNVEVTLEK